MLALDRLFLSALVDEIRNDLPGAVVRRVDVDREAEVLALETSLAPPSRLVVSFSREAPGLYRGEPPGAPVTSPSLKSRLVGARLADVAIADVDRLVTLSFARTRLSGRRQGVSLALEVMGARVALYVVDLDTMAVIEAFGPGRKRVAPGGVYTPPHPPPGAASLVDDPFELERRLEALDGDLLAASGATPLIVAEIRWIAKHRDATLVEAFSVVRRRLEDPRATLYVSNERLVLSPIELESKRDATARTFTSFNTAMEEVVRQAWQRRAFDRGQRRLSAAAGRASSKLARLREKLAREDSGAEEPDRLRRFGEQILAGMGRARRLRDDAIVVPDAFDPAGPEIEIAIDPRMGLPANAERYFRRARKQERARAALSVRLAAIEAREESLATFELAVQDAESLEALDELEAEAEELGLPAVSDSHRRPKRAEARSAKRLGPRTYVTSRGNTVLVGRSSRGNEEVTFKRAQPDDVWLHASGRAGAHVVLKVEPGAEATEDEIFEAAALAAFYSKGREDSHVEVMVTKRRHVSKLKGAPAGTVRVKEYRTVRVAPRRPGAPVDAAT